jgi:uncharacterized protein (TIGR03435 family)
MTQTGISIVFLAALTKCLGQNFEVAAVKPAPPADGTPGPRDMRGGPGTEDPAQFTCMNCPLVLLVMRAYRLDRIRVFGPDWVRTTRFDIAAKIPSETQKLPPAKGDEQLELMLQNLLAERFKLAMHFEKKQMDLYELTVSKSGPKMTQSSDDPNIPANPPREASRPTFYTTKLDTGKLTMAMLARNLSTPLNAPVLDATGLAGRFDVTLFFIGTGAGRGRLAPPASDGNNPLGSGDRSLPGPDIFEAVREQLGLELKHKKGPVDILVIDHAEKVPTEN